MTVDDRETVVLSALEFDVLWETAAFRWCHPALRVPSPGRTHTERAELVRQAWESLQERGLALGREPAPGLLRRLRVLAAPERAVDCWVFAERAVTGLAAAAGGEAVLGVLDNGEVWLIPARASSLVESAVSVVGDRPAGRGRSVSVPFDVLAAADRAARGDPDRLITRLERRGVVLTQAQILAGMMRGMYQRGQFGVQRRGSAQSLHRGAELVSFHDTPRGRYLYLIRASTDGRRWATVTPADNRQLVASVAELLDPS
ncbi:MAG: ESX secretion-associated protein EspG [Sciscionella sp.]